MSSASTRSITHQRPLATTGIRGVSYGLIIWFDFTCKPRTFLVSARDVLSGDTFECDFDQVAWLNLNEDIGKDLERA